MAAGKLRQQKPPGKVAETRRLNMDDADSVGEADKTEMAIISARQRGDKDGLISALETKVTEIVSQICC